MWQKSQVHCRKFSTVTYGSIHQGHLEEIE